MKHSGADINLVLELICWLGSASPPLRKDRHRYQRPFLSPDPSLFPYISHDGCSLLGPGLEGTVEEGLPGILSVSCGWKVLHHKAVNSPPAVIGHAVTLTFSLNVCFSWDVWWLRYWFTSLTEKLFIRFGFLLPYYYHWFEFLLLWLLLFIASTFFSTFQHPFALSTYHLAAFFFLL